MLKLTNSVCRYLVFKCDKVHKAHVRNISHLTSKWKPCGTECVSIKVTAQFHSTQQLRQHGHGKKRLKIKIPPLASNETREVRAMSHPTKPSRQHASCGGDFEVSAETDDDWWQYTREAGYTGDGRTHNIPPDFRVWEVLGEGHDPRYGATFTFKILSYNVLAQYLLESHPYLYTDCSPRDLKWKIRAARLYDEITRMAPDVICLQEVQVSHLESFYSKFEKIGYFGVIKQKTGHRQDGCAIYFKTSMFQLTDHVHVEFFQPELPILNRDNIGVMVKLLPHDRPCTPIVVATTHLLYNPKRTDVRIAQMKLFLAEIDRFAYFNNGRECGHLPIILTGDFNSTPDSPVVKLLDRGRVSVGQFRDGSDWRRIAVTDNCQHLSVILDRQIRRFTNFNQTQIFNSIYSFYGNSCEHPPLPVEQYSGMFNTGIIGHSLNLCSVYDPYIVNGRLGVTTFQDYWVNVDYIYFSRYSCLNLIKRLRLPNDIDCSVLGRLPNQVYGSDHLAVAAIFELRPPPQQYQMPL
ncbi:unnamed protein product [Spodoptera littoralis]|uniref:Endonuclease/exonuclease/phosphatase domain-containing protein n=1 Tax=Spodoptera littoralis TaxID=7109 RepID=A0A9P0IJK3_SPOLI|nr:unnamed protein product [Spodoptera littoralis]CAH1647901.1 unnamed protein product [Spodoptera littoralis]